jgi:hypothetical protein
MIPRSCVTPEGRFLVGLHRPGYRTANLRSGDYLRCLGRTAEGRDLFNAANFPAGDVKVAEDDWVYEIPNPLPFRGTTFICKRYAERAARDPKAIALAPRPEVSLNRSLAQLAEQGVVSPEAREAFFRSLPQPLLLALAATSTDPEDLTLLAQMSAALLPNPTGGPPAGLSFHEDPQGRLRPGHPHHELLEVLVNNPYLPDAYKVVLVLRPGAQGDSEIVGEAGAPGEAGHVFEYLRRNSYIPWGHYAANMADDAVRYRIADLCAADMAGMRHLYYQRTFVRLADDLGLGRPAGRRCLGAAELEALRRRILAHLETGVAGPPFTATLWGWNFGFDYAASGYRLHGSHQQIHQQFAMVPAETAPADGGNPWPAFACGDLVGAFVEDYRRHTGADFFEAYTRALTSNRRTDGRREGPSDLVVWSDARVVLFVPKAQTSQWELQLMPLAPVGNILEADTATRDSLDQGLLAGMRVLERLGARMVTVIEFAKRLDAGVTGQRLLMSFLPRLPHSPGAFSEAQLRWVMGHYPEDFAAACRRQLLFPPGQS